MKSVIWNEEEIKYINKEVLSPANLKVDEHLNLIKPEIKGYVNYKKKILIYNKFFNELSNIYYFTDRNKIEEILTRASEVKFDPNNQLHWGLIKSLSNINPSNHYEIFIIFNEIIGKYDSIINSVATKAYTKLDKNSTIDLISLEEEVLNIMNYILSFSNQVFENELFLPLIDSLNGYIKERLMVRIREKYGFEVRYKEYIEHKADIEYHKDLSTKIRKKLNRKELRKVHFHD